MHLLHLDYTGRTIVSMTICCLKCILDYKNIQIWRLFIILLFYKFFIYKAAYIILAYPKIRVTTYNVYILRVKFHLKCYILSGYSYLRINEIDNYNDPKLKDK